MDYPLDAAIWMQLSENISQNAIARQMLEAADKLAPAGDGEPKPSSVSDPRGAASYLAAALTSKRALLAVDDTRKEIDAAFILEAITASESKSAALLSSRDLHALGRLGCAEFAPADELPEESALQLLKDAVGEDLWDAGKAKQVSAKCGRVALGVAAAGAAIRSCHDWARVMEMLSPERAKRLGCNAGGAKIFDARLARRSLLRSLSAGVKMLEDESRSEGLGDHARCLELVVMPEKVKVSKSALTIIWGCDESDAADTMARLIHLALVICDGWKAGEESRSVYKYAKARLHGIQRLLLAQLAQKLFPRKKIPKIF